jgi:protein-disulfide isomerase
MVKVLFATIFLSLLSSHVEAQTPACDKLKGDQKELANELLQSQHPYDCCDDTIANCLKEKPPCALAYRLAENICQRIAMKQDAATIKRALSRRARSVLPGSKAKIDLQGVPMVGDPKAPIVVVEYACARCPYCSKITPKLYDAVEKGPLKGKVKLYFKPFPIRSHEYSKETGLGFVAAAKLGHFWEFLLYTYEYFDSFCIAKQGEWAEAAGMEPAEFERLVADPTTRKLLVDSKKEGILNKVDATPTFFINGQKFVGDHTFEEVTDVIEEFYDNARGVQRLKK